jgi:hypothetical protein
MKRSAWWFGGGCVLLVLVLTLGGAAALWHVVEVVGIPGFPIYRPVDYDPGLTREAATANPVIAALSRYRREHGLFPSAAAQLVRCLPAGSTIPWALQHGSINGWNYHKHDNGKSYEMVRGLGRDPELAYVFQGSTGQWVFRPCDGSPDKTIKLNP